MPAQSWAGNRRKTMYEYWMKQAGYWMCSKYSVKCKRLHMQAYMKKALEAYMKENCA